MDTSTILQSRELSPDDLLLDPNNPRLVESLDGSATYDDAAILAEQDRLKKLFVERSRAAQDEFTDITDLFNSMIRIGYVGIDRIVVRELFGQDKYLVIEGNRRVSTIKLIRERAKQNSLEETELKSYKQVKDSFEKLDVLVLKTKGLSKQQIDERVSIILGLRHFGSVLDWKPLNRAFNTYQNYMEAEPPLDNFAFDNNRVDDVRSRLSVSATQVKSSLKTYIVYRQLSDLSSSASDEHYSLIEAGLGLCKYNDFFKQDPLTYELDAPSLDRLRSLCQFDKRKEGKGTGTLIIPEPKKFNVLGRILRIAHGQESETIRSRAKELIAAIERGELDEETGELAMSVDKALSLLTAEIHRKEWIRTIEQFLDEQDEKLPVASYDGEGNHLMAKEGLENAILHLRTIFSL